MIPAIEHDDRYNYGETDDKEDVDASEQHRQDEERYNRQRYEASRKEQTTMIHNLILDRKAEGAKTARQCFNNAKVFMVNPLGNYQNEGVEFMLVHEHMAKELGNDVPGGICADSIGLGKTYMSARLILGDYRPDRVRLGFTPVTKKTLIVTPNSVTSVWSKEFGKLMRSVNNAHSAQQLANMGFSNAANVINNMRGQQIMYVGGRGFVMEMDKTKKQLTNVPETVGVVVCSITLFTQSRKSQRNAEYTDEEGVPKFITDTHWHRLIVDEGHMARNVNTATHRALLRIKATNKWILSATPVHNKVKELMALASIIGVPNNVHPHVVKEQYMLQRIQKYEEERRSNLNLIDMVCVVEDVQLTSYEALLYNIVQDMADEAEDSDRMAFYTFLRQCSTDHRVYLSGAIDRAMSKAKANGSYVSRDAIIKTVLDAHDIYKIAGIHEDAEPDHAWDRIMKTSSTKMKHLVTHLERIRASNRKMTDPNAREKSIVFCEYITEVECLCAALNQSHINFVKVVGGSSKDERFASFHCFETRSEYRDIDTDVLILQSSCGSEGLNLQCANNVFFMSPTWNPCRELQAIGRCYRSGQDKRVKVVRFVTHMMQDDNSRKDCMDQRCLIVQDRKKALVKTLLEDDSVERCLGKIKLSDDEVKYIVSGLQMKGTKRSRSSIDDAEETEANQSAPDDLFADVDMILMRQSHAVGGAGGMCDECTEGGVSAIVRRRRQR